MLAFSTTLDEGALAAWALAMDAATAGNTKSFLDRRAVFVALLDPVRAPTGELMVSFGAAVAGTEAVAQPDAMLAVAFRDREHMRRPAVRLAASFGSQVKKRNWPSNPTSP